MLESLSKVGSTAYTAGASLQELEGYITAVTVATGADGGEVGTGIKSIMSKIFKLGADGLDSEEAMKPERALNALGVSIRDINGEFRKIDDILSDLNVEWKDMDNSQKIATAQAVGGVQQYDKFLALMNNFDVAVGSTSTAMNSQGSAIRENEKHIDSIEGKMATLKATMQGFWTELINSNTIKSTVDGLTSIVNKLSELDLKTVVTGASFVATMILIPKILKTVNLVSTFTKASEAVGIFQKMIVAMRAESALASLSMGTMGVASAGLSAGFRVLATSIWTSIKASVAFMITPLGLTLGAIALALGGLTYAFAKNAKEQKIFDEKVKDNKESVDALTDSLKRMNEEGISGIDGVDEASKPLQEKQDQYQAELQKRQKLLDEIEALKSKGVTSVNTGGAGSHVDSETIRLQSLELQLKNSTKAIEGMNKEFKDSGIVVDELTGKVKNLEEANEAMIIPKATKQYEETKTVLYEIEQELARVNELQEISPDLASELLAKYPELESQIGNIVNVQEFLNNKQKEQVDIQNEAYGIMMGNDTDFYNSKLLNDENWLASVRASLVAMGVSEDEAYNYDLSQFTTLNQLKDGKQYSPYVKKFA